MIPYCVENELYFFCKMTYLMTWHAPVPLKSNCPPATIEWYF